MDNRSGMTVVCVFDVASQSFHAPLFFRANGAALRWFEDHLKRGEKGDPMCAHPDHFQLFHLGSFNDFDGSFNLLERPNLLVHGSSFLEH